MNLERIQADFSPLKEREEIYRKIMEWGKLLPPFDSQKRQPSFLVPGCQSQMYLYAEGEPEALFFYAASDALISAGLAALLIEAYKGASRDLILTTPPTFLTELGILPSLTPGRAQGAASLYLKFRQLALRTISCQQA